ncbi:MAG: hypothetical protein M3546_06905 [Actinomycetota bacterium]|nr:hypothetical protein [Actinomycetota bacterium]
MLYRPEAFEPLTDEAWDKRRIEDAIREIVSDTEDALRGPKLLWRADDWDRWRATSPLKSLFAGAAGVLWALDELRRLGHAETRLDLGELALRNLELFRARPDFMKIELPEPRMSSLLCGETGILLVTWRLAPGAELADALLERVRGNSVERGGGGHVGHAGNADRRAGDARLHRGRALARGVAGERGCALVSARRGRVLDAASPRP